MVIVVCNHDIILDSHLCDLKHLCFMRSLTITFENENQFPSPSHLIYPTDSTRIGRRLRSRQHDNLPQKLLQRICDAVVDSAFTDHFRPCMRWGHQIKLIAKFSIICPWSNFQIFKRKKLTCLRDVRTYVQTCAPFKSQSCDLKACRKSSLPRKWH